jgi:hypothetical protein
MKTNKLITLLFFSIILTSCDCPKPSIEDEAKISSESHISRPPHMAQIDSANKSITRTLGH